MSEIVGVFRWRDALDIAIVAVVVYRILLMFRGTRAVQMLVGLGALVVATLVSHRLDLFTVGWIIDNFRAFWVLALVVLFQPEFRRALTRIGQGRVLRGLVGTRQEQARVVGEVTQSAFELAARRIGALVVLERSVGLRQYAELGQPLDALLSADLLVSVFQTSSPLHDGAVIVQGGRLMAAGCFLPLSRSREIGRALGTRHRAAIGISDETDAVAIVVSEETGRVSLAVDGEIHPAGDAEGLRRHLGELLGDAPAREREALLVRGVRRLLPRAHDNV